MVFTITESTKNPYFNIVKMRKNKIRLVCEQKNKVHRRQDAPRCYDLTTVCYVFKPNYILKNNNLMKGKTGVINVPKIRSIDIDDKTDYKIAQLLSKIK